MHPRRVPPLLFSIAIVVPVGFYGKRLYHGPAAHWVADSFGGVFYEILWCLVLALLIPRWKASRIALTVLIATCILEFLQLWHPPLLEWLRSFFIGRTILGSFFDWSDFPYYFIGSALGWLWLRAIGHHPPLLTRASAAASPGDFPS
ncbi:MAG TPA: DUF2809 domain-containing protein [Candidatus Solibacter sp.]|jgi:hypothetical protein